MKLSELLDADRIVIGAKGETVREAAQELMHVVIASGHALDPERLDALLTESLPGEAVTLGQRAFLLHFRTDAVDRLTVTLGVTAAPVHREHDAAKEGRVILMVLAPPREAPMFLRTLGTLSRLLGREEFVAALEAAPDAEAVLALDDLREGDLADQLLVRHVCSSRKVSVGPNTTISDAAALMAKKRLQILPIVSEADEVLGIVGYGELLRHLLPLHVKRASGEYADEGDEGDRDPLAIPVRDVMDRSVLCISEDQPLADVARTMVNKKLDRVPVVREGALVGMLTREDIVRRLFGP